MEKEKKISEDDMGKKKKSRGKKRRGKRGSGITRKQAKAEAASAAKDLRFSEQRNSSLGLPKEAAKPQSKTEQPATKPGRPETQAAKVGNEISKVTNEAAEYQQPVTKSRGKKRRGKRGSGISRKQAKTADK